MAASKGHAVLHMGSCYGQVWQWQSKCKQYPILPQPRTFSQREKRAELSLKRNRRRSLVLGSVGPQRDSGSLVGCAPWYIHRASETKIHVCCIFTTCSIPYSPIGRQTGQRWPLSVWFMVVALFVYVCVCLWVGVAYCLCARATCRSMFGKTFIGLIEHGSSR